MALREEHPSRCAAPPQQTAGKPAFLFSCPCPGLSLPGPGSPSWPRLRRCSMTIQQQQLAVPSSAADALSMLDDALGYLARADPRSLTLAEQATALRGLQRAEARQTAALTGLLSAFVQGGGLEADGHCSMRGWLIVAIHVG